jgi:hypothetical protein
VKDDDMDKLKKRVERIEDLLVSIFSGRHHYTSWSDMVDHNEDEIEDFLTGAE